MAIKIGINGFGRIAQCSFRVAMQNPDRYDLCAINQRNRDLDYIAYMIKYDSVFGKLDCKVETYEDGVIFNGKKIRVFGESDVSKIAWAEAGAEYILESTGAFNTTELASGHFAGGAKKVVLSAPAKDKETPTYVLGVNHEAYDPKYRVVSNASCTTNCLAPLAKILEDAFGIQQALMTTVHSATSKQQAVDARVKGKDFRIGRSMYNNIIPSTTGAAKATALVIPSLKGKITGMSFRVPTNDGSVVDLTCRLATKTNYDAICAAIREASEGRFKGIVEYSADDLVSEDIIGNSHTCIFDSKAGIMLDDTFVKLIAWYDNEWGYSNKALEMLSYIASHNA